jgi:hypothetical protein
MITAPAPLGGAANRKTLAACFQKESGSITLPFLLVPPSPNRFLMLLGQALLVALSSDALTISMAPAPIRIPSVPTIQQNEICSLELVVKSKL